MQIARGAALLVSLATVACGDDGGPRLIDSGIGNTDAPPIVCTAVTLGAGDVTVSSNGSPSENAGRSLGFYVEAGTIAGDEAAVYLAFRHTQTVPTIPATVEISGDNTDYFDCTTCVYALTFDAGTGEVSKLFMAQSGTITFTGEPVTTRHLTAAITNLRLQEFDFDQNTGATVFNPLGACATIDASIDLDNVPNDWTCDAGLYYAAVETPASSCDCACGVFDGDCRNPAAATADCTGATPVCWPDADAGSRCVAAVTNDTCATAGTPTVGPATAGTNVQITGNSVGAHRNYNAGLNAATCTKYGQPGPDVIHAVTLLADTAYSFTLDGLDPEMDMSLSLVGPGTDTLCGDGTTANPVMNCVGGDDEGFEGDAESFNFTTSSTGAGTYYLIVDSFNRDDAGPYTITVARP